MNKILLASSLAGALVYATTAHATLTNFDLGDGTAGSLATDQSSLDWNSDGSGVGIGIGPFGTPFDVGDTFTFLYQANLVNVNPGGAPAGLDVSSNGTWDNDYEFTIAIRLYEEVNTFTDLGGGLFASTFVRDPTQTSTVSIFYDTPAGGLNANTPDGTGFVDGLEVLRMTIDDGVTGFPTFSSFVTDSPVSGQGSAKIHGSLINPGDFVNADYLTGVEDFIFDIEFQSNLNYPPGTSTTTAFHQGGSALYPDYTVVLGAAPSDILFKVDGDNQFSVPIPAPLYLLGLGFCALGFLTRRRNQRTCG